MESKHRPPFKIRDLMVDSIKTRLLLQAPYLSRWNQAIAIGAAPAFACNTLKIQYSFADEIWFLSGDRSEDYNTYLKRLLYLKTYFSTELYMLTDRSEGFEETWGFLNRRI